MCKVWMEHKNGRWSESGAGWWRSPVCSATLLKQSASLSKHVNPPTSSPSLRTLPSHTHTHVREHSRVSRISEHLQTNPPPPFVHPSLCIFKYRITRLGLRSTWENGPFFGRRSTTCGSVSCFLLPPPPAYFPSPRYKYEGAVT